jgi:hypothetical protein
MACGRSVHQHADRQKKEGGIERGGFGSSGAENGDGKMGTLPISIQKGDDVLHQAFGERAGQQSTRCRSGARSRGGCPTARSHSHPSALSRNRSRPGRLPLRGIAVGHDHDHRLFCMHIAAFVFQNWKIKIGDATLFPKETCSRQLPLCMRSYGIQGITTIAICGMRLS